MVKMHITMPRRSNSIGELNVEYLTKPIQTESDSYRIEQGSPNDEVIGLDGIVPDLSN